MTIYEHYIVFPEGDRQEIQHRLRINQLVDLNGTPLELPLRTFRMIVYRVSRVSKQENKGEEITSYFLTLVRRDEMHEYVR